MSAITGVRSAAAQALKTVARPEPKSAATSEFARVLQTRLDEQKIAITAHAADRMVRRGLIPDDATVRQLNTAFDLAEQKGSREALFLLDQMAVIASVPDRTVKTALDRASLAAGVFTQIDAAIVLSDHNHDNNQQSINQSPRSFGRAPSGEAAIQPGGLPL